MSTAIKSNYYAGFFKRFVACLIDGIILSFLYFIAVKRFSYNSDQLFESQTVFTTWLIESCLTIIIGWLYYAIMESSSLQATLGKKVLEIAVTDTRGNKISFAKATVRYLGKWLFYFIWIAAFFIAFMGKATRADNWHVLLLFVILFLIGCLVGVIAYLMVLFTPEKQALHDIMARCTIVNDSRISGTPPWKALIISLVVVVIIGRIIVPLIPAVKESEQSIQVSNPTPSTTPTPTPTPTSTPTSTPTTTSTATKNSGISSQLPPQVFNLLNGMTLDNIQITEIQTPRSYNICNAPLQLLKPDNDDGFDADLKLDWTMRGQAHVARLKTQGQSGRMRVVTADENNKLKAFDQTMQLYTSAKGYVLIGFNPVDANTQNEAKTYQADNLIIRRELNGQTSVFNCDNGGRRASVNIEQFKSQ